MRELGEPAGADRRVTRRLAVAVAAALFAGTLAGCTGSTSSSDSGAEQAARRGAALVRQATGSRDLAAARTAARAVRRLGDDDRAPEVVVPKPMREDVARVLSYWIRDVHAAFIHGEGGVGGESPDLTYDPEDAFVQGPNAFFLRSDVIEVMNAAAQDPRAYRMMWDYERAYAALLLDQVAGQEDTFHDRTLGVRNTATNAASVLATIRAGNVESVRAIVAGGERGRGAPGRGAARANYNAVAAASAVSHPSALETRSTPWCGRREPLDPR